MMAAYNVSEKIWKTKGKGGWYFVTFPEALSVKIKNNHIKNMEGWGRLKVSASIGEVCWNTSIWYDTKANSYLLPLKAEIRKKLGLESGDRVKVKVCVNHRIRESEFEGLDF